MHYWKSISLILSIFEKGSRKSYFVSLIDSENTTVEISENPRRKMFNIGFKDSSFAMSAELIFLEFFFQTSHINT